MTESTSVIVYKNVLAWRGCEKLYLDHRTCDVFFVFKSETDEIEKLPAHKSILSATSEVFDAMFYGPSKQDGDINIVDSSPSAFKEFLQYFYLSTVKLTGENVAGVMNLGKQYMLNDCINTCTEFCESTLTMDNVCWGYELAILFEQENLKKFCERKIGENPNEIFQSNSFLICDKNSLRHILQMDSLNCDESVVFDGCVAWAKAACIQKGLDEDRTENWRIELGNLFNEIRFGRMTLEHFYSRVQSHKDLFSADEFREIIGKIASKDFQPRMFNPSQSSNGDALICDREHSDSGEYRLKQRINQTTFRSNCLLLLKSFIFYVRLDESGSVIAKIRISENSTEGYAGDLRYYEEISINYSGETDVELTSPIPIKPGIQYSIEIDIKTDKGLYSRKFETEVRMDEGTVINFSYDIGIVECLHFIHCNKLE